MSNVEKKRIPEAPVPISVPGNLLSSIAPPSQLPNFVTAAPTPPTEIAVPQPIVLTAQPAVLPQSLEAPSQNEVFSPAIPLSKGEPVLPTRSPEDSQATQSLESLPVSTPDMDPLGDILPGSGLLTWVKGAVSTGGILHKVAEKAKNSMDSMITTLDPQMKEYLKSGGDISIVVASEKDVKISPVREAFQAVFGKATVIGCPAPSAVTADQPVGYAAAYAAAKQRIAHIRSQHAHVTNNVPIVAVEGFLHEAVTDRWYELSLLVLSQPSLGIELQLQSQGTPVPPAAVAAAREATPPAHPHRPTGYALPVGSVVADSLQVSHTQWQEACTGVSRREILLLAARSLAGSYKKLLAVSAAET